MVHVYKICDVYEHKRRVIAIGDIHGDLDGLLSCLADVSKVITYKMDCDKKIEFEWIGEDTYVVIVGDIIDRKRDGSIIENGYLDTLDEYIYKHFGHIKCNWYKNIDNIPI